ncbi:MAG: hypothetical protein EOM25_10685 [Deltaproteobacteria bacterium]|nr:hypothetical protein [Deltaproteobacteria bacterium]
MDLIQLAAGLLLPLVKLVVFMSIGLVVGNLIEALNWTSMMARLATPITRAAHLQDVSGASFSLAFFSGVSANTMLAEAYDQGRLSRKELVLSNLFNSLPTYFLHLPTMFFIIAPVIKGAAVVYLGLTVASAFLRTAAITMVSRFLLPRPEDGCVVCRLPEEGERTWKTLAAKIWKRSRRRLRSILIYTLPIYTAVYILNTTGFFRLLEDYLSKTILGVSWLPPQALSIVVFHIAAEFTAGIAAAGALLDGGTLGTKEVVLALLVGNILSSPMRAFRHQFPYYAGIFKPALAWRLIVYNQTARIGSLILVGLPYAVWG